MMGNTNGNGDAGSAKRVGENLYLRNGVYYAVIRSHGKQVWKSLETSDRLIAKAELAKVQRELQVSGALLNKALVPTFLEAITEFATVCERDGMRPRYVRALWLTLAALGHRFTNRQIPGVIDDFIRKMSRCHSPPRRNRSCPRAIRQPVSSWKRLIRRTEKHGEFSYEIKPLRA